MGVMRALAKSGGGKCRLTDDKGWCVCLHTSLRRWALIRPHCLERHAISQVWKITFACGIIIIIKKKGLG